MSTLRSGSPRTDDCLAGGGEMGALMRDFNWSETPLGPVEAWPQSLKIAVRIMLTSRQPIWIGWGPELTYLYNDPYRSIIGGKHPRALGQPTSVVWHEIWNYMEPLLSTALEGAEGIYQEAQQLIMERHGYREETFYTFSFSPVPDDSGAVGGIICANTDDTKRVIGERRLRSLRDLAAQATQAKSPEEACRIAVDVLAESTKDVPFALLYLKSEDGASARLCESSQLSGDGLASPRIIDLTRDEPDGWPIGQVIRLGQAAHVDDVRARFGDLPGGAWHVPPENAMVLPIQESEALVSGALILGISPLRKFDEDYRTFFDLAVRQISTTIGNARAYEREKHRAEALAELDRAKTAFFSNVSHELRTPLTLLLSPVEDALAKSADPQQREQLELALRNALRLQKLVNTLLDFSRIEAGRSQATYEPTDLARFTAELASVFRSAVERARMRLIVDCQPLSEPAYVDRDMWEKIVLNLVSNAFKFTLEGEIEVSLREEGGCARLLVRDTGTGIPPEQLPHVFERFHRVEGARARTLEGTGIGLALVQELVKLHGGSVSVQSAQGQGTAFTAQIPLGQAHLPADRIGASRPLAPTALGATHYVEEALRWLPGDENGQAPGETLVIRNAVAPKAGREPSKNGARPRILLADDNADLREYLRRLLSELYEVQAVSNGQAALEALRANPPDLVLTDVMMPGRDGFGLLKELRSDPKTRSLPVIMLSARAGEEARVEGLQAGANDYLVKPFSARELLARVSSQLELARVRREVSEASEQAANILESITDGFVSLDRQWRFSYVNAEAERLYGMRREDLLGRSCWDVFPPAVGTVLDHGFHRAAAEGTAIEFEFHYEPWGRWFEINAYPSKDGGLSVYFRDVSERKRAEQLLAEHSDLLERIASGHPLDECLTAVTASISRLHPGTRACLLLADSDRKAFSGSYSAFVPPSFGLGLKGAPINDLAIGTCGEAVFRGEPVTCTDIALDDRWSEPWRNLCVAHGILAAHSEPVLSPSGQAIGSLMLCFGEPREPSEWERRLSAVATHVAAIAIERERVTLAIQAGERRLRRIIEGARDYAIVELDLQGNVAYWNSGAERLMGWSEAEILRKPGATFFTPGDRDKGAPDAEMEKVRTTGRAENERWHLRKDGSRFWGSGLVMPLTDDDGLDGGEPPGPVSGFVKVFQDRTEWRRMENHLRDQADRLKDADRRKDEFLAMLAHELRNPLAAISNAAQVSKRTDSPEHQEWSQHVIEVQVQNLSRMIDNLLDVSRITRGKIQLRKQPLNLAPIITSAVETARPLLDERGHRLVLDLTTEPLSVEGDPTRLEQVLVNLLNNASKYTEPAGLVTLSARTEGGQAVIAVEDTGVGMSPELLARAFDLFSQGDRTIARSEGGLGIGLTLVKSLVSMHGGTVLAESQGPGQGSRFTVRLPLTRKHTARPEHGTKPASADTSKGSKVLVVDDNEDTARGMARLLKLLGHDVRMAHDGPSAIEQARTHNPDTILLDIGLPGMDGYQVARTLRDEGFGQTLIIAVSGYGEPTAQARGRQAGFNHHLVKPVDFDSLVTLLGRAR